MVRLVVTVVVFVFEDLNMTVSARCRRVCQQRGRCVSILVVCLDLAAAAAAGGWCRLFVVVVEAGGIGCGCRRVTGEGAGNRRCCLLEVDTVSLYWKVDTGLMRTLEESILC